MSREIIEEVKSKHILHWSYREYSTVPEELQKYGEHIEEMYLRDNNILRLPKWLSSLTNLTRIYLAGNSIEDIPLDIDKLQNLSILELSRNNLKGLPQTIVRLKNLNHLILDFNFIEVLPKDLGNLKALYTLHINNNNLYSLPDSLCQCHSLTELCVHNNHLTHLPQAIVYLPNLETLSVHDNNLLYLPSVRFLSNSHLTFYNNLNLNYLSYHLTYGHDGDMHHLMSGCGSGISDFSSLSNIVVTITQHNRHLVLPSGLREVLLTSCVPSLFELALRKTYTLFYKVEDQQRVANVSCLRNLPQQLQKTLYDGPTSNCSQCNRNIFMESFLLVFLRSHISEYSKLFAAMFLCSAKCQTLYTQRCDSSIIERVTWIIQ